jgi:hypothetical protein
MNIKIPIIKARSKPISDKNILLSDSISLALLLEIIPVTIAIIGKAMGIKHEGKEKIIFSHELNK